MIIINIKRVMKAGFMNFWRNGWISLATILIMVVTLFVMGSLIFDRVILMSTLDSVKDKVDINVYFNTDAPENEILDLKNSLLALNEVKSVEYVSRDQALEDFKERHKDNALIIQSLDELDGNPLGAVVNIKARELSQYSGIAKFLDDYAGNGISSIIDKVNYNKNKFIFERLSEILDSAEKSGITRSLILMIISILVIFNTIRMAIYGSRDEISVMRLVGASRRFVSGPFVVEGIIYGIVSSIITMALFYPITFWLGPMFLSGPMMSFVFSGVNLFEYYISNFAQIFLILLFAGVFIGAFSSFVAVRRYLKE